VRYAANVNWSGGAAILLGLAVALGAFGAHGLKNRLDAYSMGIWEKAVFYHFIHALGMLVVALANPRLSAAVCALLLAGIVLFCGSLYALALSGVRVLGAVTPLGGLAFIAAWATLAWSLLRSGVR
jgi:uncharacterized membrane protein YgdD (TMEM256/DUF423 family)